MQVQNPFQEIIERLSKIEHCLIDIKNKPEQATEPPFLDVDGLANLLNVTRVTIYSKNSRGEIPGVCKRGKNLFFDRAVIMDWLKSSRKQLANEINSATFIKSR